jgi:hypothetical protein
MGSGALGEGKGTPWGPARYGQPEAPGEAPQLETDPNKYQSYDRSAMANQAIAQGNTAGANQMAQAKARLAATGGGRSSSANTQQMNLAGQMGQNEMGIRNQQQLQGWQDKMAQMNAANNFNLQRYGMKQAQYKTDAELAENERKNRQQAASQLGPMGGLGSMFGGY